MLVLGIETSCDETGLALYDSKKGLLADELHSQIAIHQDYGGVVPELASRDHADRVLPLLRKLLETTKKSPDDIDLVAYTAGPGLKGCLLVGSTFARTLAHAIDKPIISVNHIEAHLLAPFMEYEDLTFPFFGLLISGGHTMIVDAKNIGEYEIMGETLDDAVGEAFDKSAKLMGLDYPGGPLIEKLAKEGKHKPFIKEMAKAFFFKRGQEYLKGFEEVLASNNPKEIIDYYTRALYDMYLKAKVSGEKKLNGMIFVNKSKQTVFYSQNFDQVQQNGYKLSQLYLTGTDRDMAPALTIQ